MVWKDKDQVRIQRFRAKVVAVIAGRYGSLF